MKSSILIASDFDEVKEELYAAHDPADLVIFEDEELKVETAKEVIREAYIAREREGLIAIFAQRYNIHAQSALLKILEEPPKNVAFLLVAKAKSTFLPTILSRLPVQKRRKEHSDAHRFERFDLATLYDLQRGRYTKAQLRALLRGMVEYAVTNDLPLSQRELGQGPRACGAQLPSRLHPHHRGADPAATPKKEAPMRLKRVGIEDLAAYMERLDVDDVGLRIMAKKGEVLLFEVRDMSVGAANILKQDALSVGADLAVPKGVVTCSKKRVDGLLMATPRQLEALAKKEMAQPFGLRELGKRLRDYLKKRPAAEPKVMGVVNATDDSFYAASRFMGERAVEAMERMIGEGAAIIDVGGMSSRPGSDEIPEDEELARIKPIVDAVYGMRLYEKARFSIDTYRPKVAAYALERGFSILNDITALSDDETARVAAANGAAVVLMHMKGRPKTMQQNPYYDDVVAEVADFSPSVSSGPRALGSGRSSWIPASALASGSKTTCCFCGIWRSFCALGARSWWGRAASR